MTSVVLALPRRSLCAAAVGILAAACSVTSPEQPANHSWQMKASAAAADVASEVAVVVLVLEQDAKHRFFGRTAGVMVGQSEAAASAAATSFAALQPPPAETARHLRVVQDLTSAVGAVSRARMALVQGRTTIFAPLIADLETRHDRLSRLASTLKRE
ncbi:hypothetical protein [Nocardioides sp.]|uniref:hypothetical protein n=1 Tax=Nocardioides sp. TaxID=35761 RepID=UPI00262B0E0C|nr:hypothetical protein [Nocardioides sp.]